MKAAVLCVAIIHI